MTEQVAVLSDSAAEIQPVPAERLEAEICEMAGHLAAATCRFVDLIGQYDQSGGWAQWEMRSCAQWLSWKCRLALGTAREHVRVARALRDLPVLHGEFAAGRLSYSVVRELTRIATPGTETDLAEMAAPMTASQVERFTRAYQQATRPEDEPAPDPVSTLRWRHDQDAGLLYLSARLTATDAAVVLQALRAATGDLDHPHDPADKPGPEQQAPEQPEPDLTGDAWPPTRLQVAVADLASALTELAANYLRGKIVSADNADIYQVVVHTTPEALAGGEPADTHEGEQAGDVPPGTPSGRMSHPAYPSRCHIEDGPALLPLDAQLVACDCTLSGMLHDLVTGEVLSVGRRRRRATAAIRRAVRERDGVRCAFPGCDSRRTDLHHIWWWSLGGPTSADNFLPLCKHCHRIVHAKGYIITRDPRGGYTFTHPSNGTVIGQGGPLPGSDRDVASLHDTSVTPTTISGAFGERLDLHFSIWVALHNGRLPQIHSQPAAS